MARSRRQSQVGLDGDMIAATRRANKRDDTVAVLERHKVNVDLASPAGESWEYVKVCMSMFCMWSIRVCVCSRHMRGGFGRYDKARQGDLIWRAPA